MTLGCTRERLVEGRFVVDRVVGWGIRREGFSWSLEGLELLGRLGLDMVVVLDR